MTNPSADSLNSLASDIVELILQRTNIDEDQQDQLWDKIHEVLDCFFGYPDYNNYN